MCRRVVKEHNQNNNSNSNNNNNNSGQVCVQFNNTADIT